MLVYSFEFPLPYKLEVKEILQLACKWISGSKHNILSKDDFNNLLGKDENENVIEKGNEKVEFGYVESNDISFIIGGVKFSRVNEDDISWITTVVSLKTANQNLISIQLSCELPNASTKLPNAKKPHIIKQILEQYGGGMDGQIPVSDKEINFNNGEENFAAALIQDQAKNILPIVYISFNPESKKYLIDPKRLAKKLAGSAHVITEPSREFSIKLRDITQAKNVFNGTVGVYWPNNNGRKSYFLTETINTPIKLEEVIQKDIYQALSNKRQTTLCSWLHLRECISKQKLEKLKSRSESSSDIQEYISLYEEEIEVMKEKMGEANKEISRLQAENERLHSHHFSRSQGVLNSGNEQDLYDYEIRSFVIEALNYCLQNNAHENSRKFHIISDLIKVNKLEDNQDLRKLKIEELKSIMNDYTRMTPKILERMKKLGFKHSEDGKHHKFIFSDDSRYSGTISKTSSDHRAGKNFSSDVSNHIFK